MEKEEVIYFELNNWFSGRDYPAAEPFATWVHEYKFRDEEWLKENRLVVTETCIDMSLNWCITAPKSWVEKNCPELLTTYKEFIRQPDPEYPDDVPESRFSEYGPTFFEYTEENIGTHTYVRGEWDYPDDDEEDDDED